MFVHCSLQCLFSGELGEFGTVQEYVKNLSSAGMQPKHGLDGQFNACWYHHVKSHEIDRIRSAGISVAVIHGR